MISKLKRTRHWVFRFIKKIFRFVRNSTLPKPSHGTGKFYRRDNLVKPNFFLHESSHVELNGTVSFGSDLGEPGTAIVRVGRNAKLIINGDFVIGPGVTIIVADNASLSIGGRRDSSGSGITSDSRIMVAKEIKIGYDCIVAWGVFITDCDWHSITGSKHTEPCKIGDRVWIAHGASILKGCMIGDDSIVAAHSTCLAGTHSPHSLLLGTPAKAARTNVSWNRELN